MRKARYDMKRVICPRASLIGDSTRIAKPGMWIAWREGSSEHMGRILGRIAETDAGKDCRGYLAVARLICEATAAGIAWVNPADVSIVYPNPPAALLAWIAGDEWVKSKRDIAHILAMMQHGTTSERYISTRKDPEKAYNARPEYVDQFILKG